MARIYRRRRRLNGKLVESVEHHIEFKDHRAITRVLKAFNDKAASEEAGRKLDRLVAFRMSGEGPDTRLLGWLENCPEDWLEKLAAWSLLSQPLRSVGRDLAVHVESWRKALLAKGDTPKQAKDLHTRVTRIFTACDFRTWSDIDAVPLEQQLAEWQAGGVLSAQTRNHYVQHVRQFCQWMVDHGRAGTSPVRLLAKVNVKGHLRRERRALNDAEFLALIQSARASHTVVNGMDGPERAALYVTARRTALRWSELRALRRGAFDLDEAAPTLYLDAKDEKHPRGLPLPLKKDVARILREYFSAHPAPADAPAFNMPRRRVGAEMVRHDLARAAIDFRDTNGRVFDFHSLRGQYATDMARAGASPQVTQKGMRHSTIHLTTRFYTHLALEDQRKALERLPDITLDNTAGDAKTQGRDE